MEEAYNYLLNSIDLKYGDSVVVAVSGGPDSMALLYLLSKLRKAIDITIVVAHVNHNTNRPGQLEEQKYVEKFCMINNIIFEGMVIDDYGDDNFENEARTKRYAYFETIIKKYKAKYLFTAHHGDDLIETILMRIVRGSTLRGYSGFSKVIKRDGYTLIRPLIEVTKDEIVAFNKKNKIHYFIDSTNLEDIHTRNRFRKYIVPALKKEDKNVHKKFYKFSRTLLEYNDYIDRTVKSILPSIYIQGILNVDKFKTLEQILQMKVIYFILEQIYQDDLLLITDHHALLLKQLILSRKANTYIYLPNNLKAIKSYNMVTFAFEKVKKDSYEIEIIKYLNLPNGKNIEVIEESNKDNNNICRLSSDSVKFPLRVRTRKDGDKMYVKGMLGRKKINDIFIDAKIPTHERDIWPVVVDSNDMVVWLPGLKKSKFDKTKTEKYDIILKYY